MNKLVQKAIASNNEKKKTNQNNKALVKRHSSNNSKLSSKSSASQSALTSTTSVPENLIFYSSKLVDNNSYLTNPKCLDSFSSPKILQTRYNVTMSLSGNEAGMNSGKVITLPNRSSFSFSFNTNFLKQTIKASVKSNLLEKQQQNKINYDQKKSGINEATFLDQDKQEQQKQIMEKQLKLSSTKEEIKTNLPPIMKYKFLNFKEKQTPASTISNSSIGTSTNSIYSNTSISNSSSGSSNIGTSIRAKVGGKQAGGNLPEQSLFKEQIDKMRSISLTRIQKMSEVNENENFYHNDNFSLFSSDIKSDFLNNDFYEQDFYDNNNNKEYRLEAKMSL